MPRTYPLEIKMFAVQQRVAGHTWDEVRELVRQQFSVPRLPSRRQMQLWQKELAASPLPRTIQSEVRRYWPLADQQVREQVERVMPELVSAALRGEDVVVFVGKLVLGWLEREAGPTRFMRIVSEYLTARTASPRPQQEQGGVKHEGTPGEERQG